MAQNEGALGPSSIVSKSYETINQIRDSAEKDATEIVNKIEKMKLFGEKYMNLTNLVDHIFKNFNQVVDIAENATSGVMNTFSSKNESSIEKRNLLNNLDSLKSQTAHLSKILKKRKHYFFITLFEYNKCLIFKLF